MTEALRVSGLGYDCPAGTADASDDSLDEVLIAESLGDAAHVAVGDDPTTERLLAMAESIARTNCTVFIRGESGVGKEVISRFIHQYSPRRSGPFVAINCAALPTTLLESELFGHERGAFSGAVRQHRGVFERASGGTLLLDEVTEIAPDMQAKLLRVLQERTLFRVGGSSQVALDIRIIATTNRDLARCVSDGTFRTDLYYRLNVFSLHLLPLRARPGDVEPLTRHFVGKVADRMGSPVCGITRAAMDRLRAYGFPGNVRELVNVVERAVILAGDRKWITSDCIFLDPLNLDEDLLGSHREPSQGGMVPHGGRPQADTADKDLLTVMLGEESLAEIEQRIILSTLARFEGNRTRSAEALGISLRTLRNRLRDYREQGITIP